MASSLRGSLAFSAIVRQNVNCQVLSASERCCVNGSVTQCLSADAPRHTSGGLHAAHRVLQLSSSMPPQDCDHADR